MRLWSQAPVGIGVLRLPGFVFELANDALCKLVGRTELVGKPIVVALPELEAQGIGDHLQVAVRGDAGGTQREVSAKLTVNGAHAEAPREVHWSFVPLRSSGGVIRALGVFALDMTEHAFARGRAEVLANQLEKRELEFQTLAESIPQLAWAARPDGFIDWYNRRWYEYTGTTLNDVEGWAWQEVHDPSRIDEVMERWKAALAAGKDFEMEFPLRRADGVFRWHLTRAKPLRDEHGRVVRWFGTNTDIDDSKRAQEERAVLLATARRERENAELASHAKDEFLTTASHELRTPLNAILGWAQLLRAGDLDASAYLRAVETIERNAKAQVRLIEDILDGSRIITGKLHLEMRRVDLTQLVSAALDAVRPAAEAKGIELSADLDPDASRVLGDPERLQQVVWNLANNAIKFTPKGGSVRLRLSRVGSDIELEVSDTGEGIDPHFLPHVFDRFRQAEGSTTRRFGGLGLGLALVRHLVEAHGGTVSAESLGLGLGATFRVHLPVQAVYAAKPESVRPSPVPAAPSRPTVPNFLAGVKVLVVDDESDARELVATVLRGGGAQVTTASSAAEALEVLRSERPAVLLSDVGMPTTDGYELIRRVRAEGFTLPALALTAYAREQDRRRALEAGFDGHMAKPVEPLDLLGTVGGILGGDRQATSLERPNQLSFRADILVKLENTIVNHGVRGALRFLNSRTPHRFTAIYRFDREVLTNLYLFDAEQPHVERGGDTPLADSYCAIIAESQRAFTTADSHSDDRLRAHPARERVVSYCGVPLRDARGSVFGSLCHFDVIACPVPTAELPLMEAAAPILVRALLEREP